MTKEISISKFIGNPDLQKDNYWGFYDWFCRESSLERQAKSFIPKLRFLIREGIFNGNSTYVWFKNNCPVFGNLYTDMRFSLLNEDNTFLGGIAPSLGYDSNKGQCQVWLIDPDGPDTETKVFTFDNWSGFKARVKEDRAFKERLVNHFYK